MSRWPLLLLLLLSLSTASHASQANDLAALGLLVNGEMTPAVVESVGKALSHENPAMRAVGARLAAVRDLTALLGDLREQLAKEADPEAAREQVRAIVLIGGKGEADFVAKEIERFNGRLDGAFATAVARLGLPDAFELYDSHLRDLSTLGDTANFVQLAGWTSPHSLNPFASRAIATGDERGFRELVDALWDSDEMMEIGIGVAAMRADNEFIRREAAWALAQTLACDGELLGCRSDFTPTARQILMDELSREPEHDEMEYLFARELLRRVLALEPKPGEKALDARAWLATEGAGERFHMSRLEKFLTDEERAVVRRPKDLGPGAPVELSKVANLEPPAFQLPELLPAGLAEALGGGRRCRGWIGIASADLDARTRVRRLELNPLHADESCREGLEAMARLSLPTNRTLSSARSDRGIVVVRAAGAPLCLDEPDVEPNAERASTWTGQARRIRSEVVPPTPTTKVDPQFPRVAVERMRAERDKSHLVVMEAIISRFGCVRHLRIVRQAPIPELNSTALLAVTQWRFKPGTIEGEPVDVIFNLTVNFKLP